MFSSLAYEDRSSLETLFNSKNWWSDNTARAVNSKYFNNQADVSELTSKWELLKTEHKDGGLDYAIFGNKNAKGSWENIIVAFRGTDSIIDDGMTDLKITLNTAPKSCFF